MDVRTCQRPTRYVHPGSRIAANACTDFGDTSPLLEAILIGSKDDVRRGLIDSPISIDVNMLGQSTLHIAISRPQHLQALLEAKFDVNATDCNGRTPLMYAAIAGCTEAAIALIDAGADVSMKDNLYCNQDFIHYAVFGNQWELVMSVLDHVRHSTNFSSRIKQALLDECVVLWAGSASATRNSKHFGLLLQWGANPEVRFEDRRFPWRAESNNTLMHCLTRPSNIKILLDHGFSGFNCQNSTGTTPLMTAAEQSNPELVERYISAGCKVNHQDYEGRTAVHLCIEEIWDPLWSQGTDLPAYRCKALECAQVLLKGGSEFFQGDHCRCACSNSGCGPIQVLLKERKYWPLDILPYNFGHYIWTLEVLQTLQDVKGESFVRRCLANLIRLVKFEELELTHTCCYKTLQKGLWQKMDADEILEIMDEQKELIEELELQMQDVGDVHYTNLEDAWMSQLQKLLGIRARKYPIHPKSLTGSSRTASEEPNGVGHCQQQ